MKHNEVSKIKKKKKENRTSCDWGIGKSPMMRNIGVQMETTNKQANKQKRWGGNS